MNYKLGKSCVTNWGSFILLQIRAYVVTNWSSFITINQGKCCYKLGQLLQIGKNALQIGAGITNQGNYYKLEHNSHGLHQGIMSYNVGRSNSTVQRMFCGQIVFLAAMFNEIDLKPPLRYTLKIVPKIFVETAMAEQIWLLMQQSSSFSVLLTLT